MLLNAYFMTCLIPREIETTLNHWVVINKVILFKNEVSVNVRRKETGVFIAIVFCWNLLIFICYLCSVSVL